MQNVCAGLDEIRIDQIPAFQRPLHLQDVGFEYSDPCGGIMRIEAVQQMNTEGTGRVFLPGDGDLAISEISRQVLQCLAHGFPSVFEKSFDDDCYESHFIPFGKLSKSL